MILLNQKELYGMTENKTFIITLDLGAVTTSGFLNFTGLVYSDRKYNVFKSIQKVFTGYPIVTDQDLITHDSYIESIEKNTPIILITNERVKTENEIVGCSKKRLERAMEKLKTEGFTCVHMAKNKKEAESMIKKARDGKLEPTTSNVFQLFTKKAV